MRPPCAPTLLCLKFVSAPPPPTALAIPIAPGAELFESLLLDSEAASNWGNWAYCSGAGNDPRNRKFKTVGRGRLASGRVDAWDRQRRHLADCGVIRAPVSTQVQGLSPTATPACHCVAFLATRRTPIRASNKWPCPTAATALALAQPPLPPPPRLLAPATLEQCEGHPGGAVRSRRSAGRGMAARIESPARRCGARAAPEGGAARAWFLQACVRVLPMTPSSTLASGRTQASARLADCALSPFLL
jgi:hypothetical protein